ncbi:hypothetical protein BAUCODRAFT_122885 [Baudoinia panamericana UAMH 10762]|uniref:Poly(A) RNA polymerase mitochondrial-like central palm domain-containing protein n=1 Tax=Baudoinia panamericana (strain UAMH 10762) TaxID=717646 RepID=M2MG26_BAUPA|nr:uncharacterized protein BAUCODRAFT_122885 [Baudoinia panamericana UAMH 10762]EMC95576.1 hypothetical protein BAUCODRAFT_122885 [Baudoinia panamericana UAMH 10762]
MDILTEELTHFAAWARPTAAETAARGFVADYLLTFLRKHANRPGLDIKAELFGSETTGLSLPTSDLDIRIYDASQADEDRSYGKLYSLLAMLARRLRQDHNNWTAVTVRHSKFPIITATHCKTGIIVQIVSAPSTTNQQTHTRRYLAELPHLRDLFLLSRAMLGTRGLVNVYDGGIGSYGLLVMLVAALKRRSSANPPPQTPAQQLLHFLNFYARHNYISRGLTVTPVGKTFLKHHDATYQATVQERIRAAHRRNDPVRAGQWAMSAPKPLQPYLLCLQDPADPTNDLGRKTNAIKHLAESFRVVHAMLLARLRDGLKGEGVAGRETFVEVAVGRLHEVWAGRRKRVEKFGAEVLKKREEVGGEVQVDAAVDAGEAGVLSAEGEEEAASGGQEAARSEEEEVEEERTENVVRG